ncbi:MAG: hypothetical protein OQK05_00335 [Pseudopelagicola sp.]|nr:hypothetical protein [Pseudopelagicola sp.]
MRSALLSLFTLAFGATTAVAEDVAPADWVGQATCAQFASIMADPMKADGVSSPFTGIAYVGAVMGYIEAHRELKQSALAWGPALGAISTDCRANPDQLFKEAVKTAFK